MASLSPRVAAAGQIPSVTPPSTYRPEINKATMQHKAEALGPSVIKGAHQEELNRGIVDKIPQNVRVVCIGEASHGTHNFYSQRAEITKLLIAERGFNAVLCEADWPDMFRANEYVRGLSEGGGKGQNANEALSAFTRFPRWMWRNTAFADFVEWLKDFNSARKEEAMGGSIRAGAPSSAAEASTRTQAPKGDGVSMDTSPAGPVESGESAALKRTVGLYGMDVYSLHTSADAVIKSLGVHDPEAAKEVSLRYMCLDRYGADSQAYGMAVGMFNQPSCEAAAAVALRKSWDAAEGMRSRDGAEVDEYALAIEANSMCVAGAEEYYRKMFFRSGRDTTWNLRDSHFCDTAKLVSAQLQRQGIAEPKLMLWAHNSHLGDARATDMSWRRNELNVGQLVREVWGKDSTFNIGFTTHKGTVAASDNWDEPMKVKNVRPSMTGSIEGIMHMLGESNCAVHVAAEPARSILKGLLLTRAIGVIYRPETERWSHYLDAYIPGQFDMVIHVDESKAVTPLDGAQEVNVLDMQELPETFPEGV